MKNYELKQYVEAAGESKLPNILKTLGVINAIIGVIALLADVVLSRTPSIFAAIGICIALNSVFFFVARWITIACIIYITKAGANKSTTE